MSRSHRGLLAAIPTCAAFLASIAVLAAGYREAIASPVVRRATFVLPHWPKDARPVTLLLMSDFHVQGPDMPPERVGAIVGQANALHPDLIVAAGDFTSDKWFGTHRYPARDAVSPLGRLKAPLGVFAVLGNHDFVRGGKAARSALRAASVHLLDYAAVEAGPIALGGLDDRSGKRFGEVAKGEQRTFLALRSLPGARVLVAHGPDEFPSVPDDIALMLAGHTHCGQIVLPLIGPIFTGSDYGRKYVCGIIRERGKVLLVNAGLGTSHVPIRLGAPPEMWLITLEGTESRDGRRP
jgi:uncharacterized protein